MFFIIEHLELKVTGLLVMLNEDTFITELYSYV